MKQKTIFIAALLFPFVLHMQSQEFSFKMTFFDAVGNIDSIIIGYDPLATDSVDPVFGEHNIIDIPLDSVFDVRITNEWKKRAWYTETGSLYHIKKQIVPSNCDLNTSPISIDIKSIHWPVTASWDSSLFLDDCRKESVFTALNPGLWWDVSTPSDLYYKLMKEISGVTFTTNAGRKLYEPAMDNDDSYLNAQNDTIPVFWVATGSMPVKTNNLLQEGKFLLYPNPGNGGYYIKNVEPLDIEKVIVYDIQGRIIYRAGAANFIDITRKSNGIYFYKMILKDKRILNGMVIKR